MEKQTNEIDTKEEMIVEIFKVVLKFLKKHWWKIILIILSIGIMFIPFIFIDLSGLAGLFK